MKPERISILLQALLLLVTVLALLETAHAQGTSARQVVTLEVLELNRIDINMTSLTLIIQDANAQAGTTVPAANSDGVLFWMTNGDNKKITVASNNATPRFELKLLAADVTPQAGVPVPEIIFDDTQTRDFITGVTKTSGRCQIRYTASAPVQAGVGREMYVITYTITGS
jgi:hypothetical protein